MEEEKKLGDTEFYDDGFFEHTIKFINDWQAVDFMVSKCGNIKGTGILMRHDPDLKMCNFCKTQEAIDKHHIIPRSMGGNGKKENILYVCPNCHRKLHNEMKIKFVSGNKIVYYDEGKVIIKEVKDL